MRIGVLTGGGDCPGLNAVIRSCVLRGIRVHGDEFVGFIDGWRGLIEGESLDLDWMSVRGIGNLGGTILGTSRTNPLADDGGVKRIQANLQSVGVEALIVFGGEATLAAAKLLSDGGIPILACPRPWTTICGPPTSPSAFTPLWRSPRRRSIDSKPRDSPITVA